MKTFKKEKKYFRRYRTFRKFCPPKYVISDKNQLIFLPISKVANSSIKKTMLDKNQAVVDDNNVHSKRNGISRSYILSNEVIDYYKFTFVRNPFERLVSCYVSKYHTDKKYNNESLWYDTYLFGLLKKDKGFNHFANWVCLIPNKFADEHFIEQYSQIYINNQSTVDFIGKFETIENDFKIIQEKFNLSSLPHFNKSTKGNWMDYYSINLAKKVYKKYKKDIETFGYEKEYHQLISYLQK